MFSMIMSDSTLNIAPELAGDLRAALQAIGDSAADQLASLRQDPRGAEGLERVLVCSPFVVESWRRFPGLVDELLARGFPRCAPDRQALTMEVDRLLAEAPDEGRAMQVLRRIRRREWLAIAWRDIAGLSDVRSTLADLTDCADILIRAALGFARRYLESRHGSPLTAAGEPMPLVVLGMGKLGGGELNFSSDIDLVFLYPETGETGGTRPISNEKLFTRLGQALIRLLDQPTADGFVFRVDMRLRPFGDSGPLVPTLGFFETYLQQHGRDWERYAYVKARAIAGQAQGESLRVELLRPFVFRKYLDFGVFESLRAMKKLIQREVSRRELRDNIKLGAGGIREIEFIAQVFQLLRGGSIPSLQDRSVLKVIDQLGGLGMLETATAVGLTDAYLFLRKVENLLQQRNDEQTHDLPQSAHEQARLALGTGHGDWASLRAEIARHCQFVQHQFSSIVLGAEGSDQPDEPAQDELTGLWDQSLPEEQAVSRLQDMGIAEPGAVLAGLSGLRDGGLYRRLDETGRQRLDLLVPRALRAIAELDDPAVALSRLVTVLRSVGRRSAYFALLNENPGALSRLARLCDRSEFLARQVAEHPLLLDELLDPRIFESPPTRGQLEKELELRFQHADPEDEEAQAEALRQFQRAAVFRIAMTDMAGTLPLMKISDCLTDLAELILARALSMAWKQMIGRYGRPRFVDDGVSGEAGFAVIGYGKLGGLELGYGSDLDLVFLHDSRGEKQMTDGSRSIVNDVFFSRLATRLVHLLTMPTPSGVLYEVDMRLRPSGNAGMLVSSLRAFELYQEQEAWTWEHQALLRSRAVAGSQSVCGEFELIRKRVIRDCVRQDTLREEVLDMRERMRTELSSSQVGQFDIKQDRGGVADIEFLVQYLVLANARQYPDLLTYSDNIRQLEGLVVNALLPEQDSRELKAAYLSFRATLHQLSLAGAKGIVPEQQLLRERETVIRCWSRYMLVP